MEVFNVKTQRALSPTQIDLADYVINPFKGCLVGCLYCYARSNRQIRRINKPWGEYLYIKENFLSQLETGLDNAGSVRGVLIGSTTEPFQPRQKACELIRGILAILGHRKIPCVILTKSARVAQYLPYLQYSPQNQVYLTCNSPCIRKTLEKSSCRQADRIEAAEILTRGGVNTTVYISPIFPGLSDVPRLLESLCGKTLKVAFESYNPKLGNWAEISNLLPETARERISTIYASESSYKAYWTEFQNHIGELNKKFNFQLQFNIYPYNSYYNTA